MTAIELMPVHQFVQAPLIEFTASVTRLRHQHPAFRRCDRRPVDRVPPNRWPISLVDCRSRCRWGLAPADDTLPAGTVPCPKFLGQRCVAMHSNGYLSLVQVC